MTIEQVIARVAEHFGLSVAALTGRGRTRDVAFARQVAAYALHQHFPCLSQQRIGSLLGGLDHSTVRYSWDRVQHAMRTDSTLATAIRALLPPPPQPSAPSVRAMRWWAAQAQPNYLVVAA